MLLSMGSRILDMWGCGFENGHMVYDTRKGNPGYLNKDWHVT